jgi:hypothetical protein
VADWKDVCKPGQPAGGRVREDDVNSKDAPAAHDAGAPSPGILKFIREVVRGAPPSPTPQKPADFPSTTAVDTYPGHSAAEVHFEGRADDDYLMYKNNKGEDDPQRVFGDWLFDFCVTNCERYQIQGVIFGDHQWFSESNKGGGYGQIGPRMAHDHYNHVHVELNCDGAKMQ